MARPKGVHSVRDKAYNRNQLELCRAKIETSKLIRLLMDNALQGKELDSVRQKSVEILLRKALPDLASVEMAIENAQPFAVLPAVMPDSKDWETAFQPTKPETEH
jgi:hypothetical protein